jgi:hypothetical protein
MIDKHYVGDKNGISDKIKGVECGKKDVSPVGFEPTPPKGLVP